jgi:hypothetical protein
MKQVLQNLYRGEKRTDYEKDETDYGLMAAEGVEFFTQVDGLPLHT